jgi:hypothetical protein
MSGFVDRKSVIVDSTARSRGASSRKDCGGEFEGVEGVEEGVEEGAVEGREWGSWDVGSWGGVVVCVWGVAAVDEGGRARLFFRRWYRDNSPLIRFEIFASFSSVSGSVVSGTDRSRRTDWESKIGQTYYYQ